MRLNIDQTIDDLGYLILLQGIRIDFLFLDRKDKDTCVKSTIRIIDFEICLN